MIRTVIALTLLMLGVPAAVAGILTFGWGVGTMSLQLVWAGVVIFTAGVFTAVAGWITARSATDPDPLDMGTNPYIDQDAYLARLEAIGYQPPTLADLVPGLAADARTTTDKEH